ncbi:hemolin-like [Epargyreus clarus]|uniref:hemolin-like n=1 Tax=Epargyreus clarus TaxID=520877 RepID=UPI003C2D0B49
MVFTKAVIFVACAVICASLPVEKLPVLKWTPAEYLFRVADQSQTQPMFLECVTTENIDGITYKWVKNGKEFHSSDPDVTRREGEGTLIFIRPKPEDAGDYQCFAESDQGVASSNIISVKRTYISTPDLKTQKHTPIEGRPYKLDCPIPDSYPKPEIKWVHQLESDPSISNEVADSRITVSPEGTLYISSVKQSEVTDNFKYVCLGKNPGVEEAVPFAEHYIQSLVKDTEPQNHDVVKQYASEDQTAQFGDKLYLYCIYGGDPLAHPDWYKDGKNVNNSPKDRVTRYNKSKGKRLLVRDVWLADAGEYTCIVDNEVGKPLNHTMHLNVVSSPRYEEEPADLVQAKEGQDLTIPCTVAALPVAKVTWTYNAKPLPQNDRLVFNPVNPTKNMTSAELTIKGVQKSDKGYYGCRAENDYGHIYSEALVYV